MRDIYSLDIGRYYPGLSKEPNGKGLPAVDRWKPFLSLLPVYQVGIVGGPTLEKIIRQWI
jgi:hypothetical protein